MEASNKSKNIYSYYGIYQGILIDAHTIYFHVVITPIFCGNLSKYQKSNKM